MRKNRQGELILEKDEVAMIRVLLWLQIEDYDEEIKQLSEIVLKNDVSNFDGTLKVLEHLIYSYGEQRDFYFKICKEMEK